MPDTMSMSSILRRLLHRERHDEDDEYDEDHAEYDRNTYFVSKEIKPKKYRRIRH